MHASKLPRGMTAKILLGFAVATLGCDTFADPGSDGRVPTSAAGSGGSVFGGGGAFGGGGTFGGGGSLAGGGGLPTVTGGSGGVIALPPPPGTGGSSADLSPTGIPNVPDVTSAKAALPIIGGTLLVTRDSQYAVAADPDRDRVFVVDLGTKALLHAIALEDGDEPGRMAEDASGRIHVVARRGGVLVTIDPATGEVTARRAVCPAPRGVTYDAVADRVLVACKSGELVWFEPTAPEAERSVQVARDLRDVVVDGDRLLATTFRLSEVFVIGRDGTLGAKLRPNTLSDDSGAGVHEPHVARRMQRLSDGRIFVQHQRSDVSSLSVSSYGVATGCGLGVTQNTVSILAPGAVTFTSTGIDPAGFMADLAVSPDGASYAALNIVLDETQVTLGNFAARVTSSPCAALFEPTYFFPGQVTAAAFDGTSNLILQSREPAALYVGVSDTAPVVLDTDSRKSTGQIIFHMVTPSGAACASCHPEGGDDGTTWFFQEQGLRRTQSIWGGVLETAPFHWQGDLADMSALMLDTFVARMEGEVPSLTQVEALATFVESLPSPASPSVADADAVSRGKEAFSRRGCSSCHAGSLYTNNLSYDVGTGGIFQVPSLLGVAYRAPYLHDGCARTLEERFGRCGGDNHGDLTDITESEISDLIQFLESL